MGGCPEASDGTGSNRAECHTIAHELIGEPFPSRAGELRTEGADTSKAALAREIAMMPNCNKPEDVIRDTGETEASTDPLVGGISI